MKSTFLSKEGNKVSLKIEVNVEKFEECVQKSYLKNKGKFNVPGFRKGKVPRKIIEMNYGEGVFYEDAINIAFPEAYDNAIEENNLDPVDRPEVDIEEIEKGKSVIFTVNVTVKPEVKLGQYEGIELEKVEYNVTKDEVEEEIKKIQNQNARIIEADERPIKEGDIVTIDYEGFADDEQFEGGTAQNQNLEIGSGKFIPGFEDQLIGKNREDEVEVKVTFPDEYHADNLAGKDAVFKVKIHEVKQKELPEVDDELAKDVSEFETLEEFKNDIQQRLEKEAEEKQIAENENNAVEKIVENSEVDIPEVMIENQIDNEINNLAYRLQFQGLDINKYLELTNNSIEDLREDMRERAEKAVKADLVLESISKEKGIDATEEEVNQELEKMSKQYNQDIDKLKERLKREDLNYMKQGIIKRKTVEFLVENAKIK